MNTVYKSIDGGTTWKNLNDGSLGTKSGSIKGLAISNTDSNVIFAGALNGVFQSSDGGTTWQDIGSGLPFKTTAGIYLTKDESTVVVPTLGGGVFTGSLDAGASGVTWGSKNYLATDIYNIQLEVDPNDSNTVFASSYPGGLFKTNDNGNTWIECNFGLASFEVTDANRQGYYAFAISPDDGNDLFLGLYGVGIYKSEDGGGTWAPAHGDSREMKGATVTAVLFDQTDFDTIYAATESGVYISADKGGNWTTLNTGLTCTDIKTLDQDSSGILVLYTVSFMREQKGMRCFLMIPLQPPGNSWPDSPTTVPSGRSGMTGPCISILHFCFTPLTKISSISGRFPPASLKVRMAE